ncbi:glycosyltransferase family 2 protein [Candidatus Poribacteria bacterium]|nr:glycosyltransferase family 2 protein [Candidatus Poribacteria bacterium]
MISVVVPIYNEEEVLLELYRRLKRVMEGIGEPYEIIFVNDGSEDRSLQVMMELRERDARVKIVDLSRNFGHQIAITAGMDYSCGDGVIVMDGDLQDPPEVIEELVRVWREGYDVVHAVRVARRGEGFFKRFTARGYYRLIGMISEVDIPREVGDFRLLSRRVVDEVRGMRERSRFIRGLVRWVGFRQGEIYYEREERFAGESKYTLRRMVRFALDGVTSFSRVPLEVPLYVGLCVSGLSFLCILVLMVLGFLRGALWGYGLILASMLFLGGVELVFIGILGEYVGRIYEEVKGRPLYVVREAVGFDGSHLSGSRHYRCSDLG